MRASEARRSDLLANDLLPECPHCQEINNVGAVHCSECGARMTEISEARMNMDAAKVYIWLGSQPGGRTEGTIRRQTGIPYGRVLGALRLLLDAGKVRQDGAGKWHAVRTLDAA